MEYFIVQFRSPLNYPVYVSDMKNDGYSEYIREAMMWVGQATAEFVAAEIPGSKVLRLAISPV